MTKRLSLLCLLLLAACDNGSVRDTLGITRRAPDEFQVIARPPLSVPPEFNLRPPAGPGETDAQGAMISPRQDAQDMVLGTSNGLLPGTAATAIQPVQSDALPNAADALFLQNAGAQNPDADIRRLLQAETPPPSQEQEKTMLERLRSSSDKEPVVDSKAEQQRLQENKTEGKPVTTGETPMVMPKDKGPLGRLLGY